MRVSTWKSTWKNLSKKEKVVVSGLLLVVFIAGGSWIGNYYYSNTEIVPAQGGQYTEGVVGKPKYINPILAQGNEVDMDLATLMYSSLMTYDAEGNLIPELATNYAVGDQGKIFDFFLHEDAYWHDGEKVTADDVVFTVQTIQNPDYKSPLKTNFQGVQVEKVDDYTVRFILQDIYAPFIYNTTFGILPKHIWQYISPENAPLAEYNIKPIGSGPFAFFSFKRTTEEGIIYYEMERNENYFGKGAYLDKIIFKFYQDQEELLEAYNKKEVTGINYLTASDYDKVKNKTSFTLYTLNIPRYFAVFFNPIKSKVFTDTGAKKALNYAVNKPEILSEILNNQGEIVDSPILPGLLGYTSEITNYEYSVDKAKEILAENGWIDNDDDGILEKGDTDLAFELVTVDWPELQATAEMLVSYWKELGAEVLLKVLNIADLQQNYIRTREYEALLFGEVLGADPDPFAFWHSTQKKDPGLNLALYDNPNVDKLLEEGRQTHDEEIRQQKYEEFQKELTEDAPVVFLYRPWYLYGLNKEIQGVKAKNIIFPNWRFAEVENWYLQTERAWK